MDESQNLQGDLEKLISQFVVLLRNIYVSATLIKWWGGSCKRGSCLDLKASRIWRTIQLRNFYPPISFKFDSCFLSAVIGRHFNLQFAIPVNIIYIQC